MAGSSEVGVRTTPTAIIVNGLPRSPSTTPRPHRVRPGSTPMTRTLRAPRLFRTPVRKKPTTCGPDLRTDAPQQGPLMPGMGPCRCLFSVAELGHNLVAPVAVGPDVLNIIAVL